MITGGTAQLSVGGVLDAQLQKLRLVFADASAERLPDGSVLVCVPDVPLSQAWSAPKTTVWFLAPVGYPVAKPDCFWAESALRLQGGAMPASSGVSTIPGDSVPRLWFSWHAAAWNAVADDLLTYTRVIQARLATGR